ncbi:MAG TPA: ATP synthase F1 subunit gamma [Candidatus Binatia bacterium]|jgi:F-type H+-transporting ATPase subunit gamma|nr:ATP synthase F1 subunit gamma [Candidatus Binatia bacterium]
MPVSTRIIRRRIKSVTNTRKITKAMELVAASKMRRAIASVLATRPYAEAAWRAVAEIAKVSDPGLHPLLAKSKEKKSGRVLLVVFTSDRGLCGGFNAQMLREVAAFLRVTKEELDIIAVGKKGQGALLRMKKKIIAAFADLTNNPRITDVRTIADIAVGDFTKGTYDAVHIAFTDYRSALTQKPIVRQLLPIVRIGELGDVEEAAAGKPPKGGGAAEPRPPGTYEYLFEPSPEKVLDMMLPRLVESQVYQSLLESSASEHSARMMAMRSASDAASDMIDDLTLTYNQARQAGITREIAEISSGKAALE